MSMGSDFAAGMSTGIRTGGAANLVQPANVNANPWQYLTGVARNVSAEKIAKIQMMGRGGGGGGGAGKILKDSQTEFLEKKEKMLKNEALQIENARAEQAMTQSRNEAMAKSSADAESRAQGLRTTNQADEKKRATENAIRGAYSKDSSAIASYINQYGDPNQNIKGIDFDDPEGQGRVFVDFGDDNVVAYNGPKDMAEKLIAPMALMEQGLKGKMTEAQTRAAETKDVDAQTRKTSAEAASAKAGMLTAQQRAKLEGDVVSAEAKYAKDTGLPADSPQVKKYGDQVRTRLQKAVGEGEGEGRGVDEKTKVQGLIKRLEDSNLPPKDKKERITKAKQTYKDRTGKDYDSDSSDDDDKKKKKDGDSDSDSDSDSTKGVSTSSSGSD